MAAAPLGNLVNGAEPDAKGTISEPSMMSRRTEMRSDNDVSHEKRTEDTQQRDDDFQNFQVYQMESNMYK